MNIEVLPDGPQIDVGSAQPYVMLGLLDREFVGESADRHGLSIPEGLEGAERGDTARMPAILFSLLILVPIAELYVIVQVGQEIGIFFTLVLLISVSILGAYLLKREGAATWRRVQEQMARGKVPTAEATDGALILMGGALLLTPGFLTDIVGLLFVFPVSRAAVKKGVRKLMGGWIVKRMGPAGYAGAKIYETSASRVSRRRATDASPSAEGRPHPLPEGVAEDDSPDS